MRIRRLVLHFFSVFLLAGVAFSADVFNIDPVHTSVAFSVCHMVVSKVHGNFRDFSGTISYDPKDVAKYSHNSLGQHQEECVAVQTTIGECWYERAEWSSSS